MLTRVTTIAAAVMTLSLLGGCGPSTAGEQDSKKSKDSSVKNSVGSQAQGEPVKDFMEGAQYDANYGQMWFPCAHDRFCMVRARLASSKKRDAAVRQLAQLVEKRLR